MGERFPDAEEVGGSIPPVPTRHATIPERRIMPKIKTHRGAAKRFRLTSGGKVRRGKAFANHILTKKSQKRKRNLRQMTLVSKADAPRIKRLIPHA